jgi:hypothetical protein
VTPEGMNMDIANEDNVQDEHDAANLAQRNTDTADLEYFGSINPDDIIDWDKSLDNPLNSGNPKTAETAFEQAQIEERAALDFEREHHLDADTQE